MMPDNAQPSSPPETERSSYSSWAFDKLRLGDTDRQGHVNNAVFATFAETGRVEFQRDEDNNFHPKNIGFVVARVEIDYRAEVHWPGTIDIGTRLLAIGRSSYRLGHGMFQGDTCVATAVSVMVVIDATTRKATPLPQPLRSYLEARLPR